MANAQLKTSVMARSSRLMGMAAKVASQEMRQRFRAKVTSSTEALAASELATRIAQARAIATSLSELKGAAMKAGQLLSIDASDMLPPEAIDILAKLQGQAEPVAFDVLRDVLMEDIGEDGLARLENLETEAAAAASIGQVHRAWVNGRRVAVKIQYPGIAESIDSDMAMLEKLAGTFLTVTRSKVDLAETFAELTQTLHLEADYVRERNNLREYAALLRDDARFVVPQPIDGLCGQRVLTMTWEDGQSLKDWIADRPSEHARTRFATSVLDLYCREFFEWGFVQTDPNHGNFLVRPHSDQIVLLDFGAALRYSSEFRRRYTELLRTIATQDPAGIVAAGINFELLDPREPAEARAMFVEMMISAMEPFAPHVQPFTFADADYAERSRDVITRFTRSLVYSPPPRKLLFLHRKLGGIFQLLKRLDVRLDLVPFWQRMVDPTPPSLTTGQVSASAVSQSGTAALRQST